MANVHLTSGSGKYEDYEDWATKLTDVYMEQAELITDAYMTSAHKKHAPPSKARAC